jgi:hypothetical protein
MEVVLPNIALLHWIAKKIVEEGISMSDPNQEWMEQLQKLNKQQFKNMLDEQAKKRRKNKVRENLKKSQEETFQSLKDKYAPPANQPTSSLADMLKNLFNQK